MLALVAAVCAIAVAEARLLREELGDIWWSSTRAPGRLDPPLTGRFENGQGVFTTEDVLGGRPVNLRFEWTADPDLPVWRQLFSFDRGASWNLNWVMTLTRETG